jgi:nitrite reductase (NADH) small subunit
MSGDPWHDVGTEDAIPDGGLVAIRVGDRMICLGRTGAGRLFALDDVCPHAGGSLAEGMVDGDQVICPLHAYAFETATGECPDDPACSVRTYDVRADAGRLQVRK